MFCSFPRQMAQLGSGEDGLRVFPGFWGSSGSDLASFLGGGVRAASPSGKFGGVGGHSTVDMIYNSTHMDDNVIFLAKIARAIQFFSRGVSSRLDNSHEVVIKIMASFLCWGCFWYFWILRGILIKVQLTIFNSRIFWMHHLTGKLSWLKN